MITHGHSDIGILGGTFNPIHNGHIELGIQALRQFDLDKVLVMPNNKPAYKDISSEIPVEHRVNMIKLAIEGIDRLEFSDFELCRPGVTYTSDTLKSLHSLHPGVHWYFIMGGDSIMCFDRWHQPDVIARLATLLVTTRSDTPLNEVRDKIHSLKNIYPFADIRMENIHEYAVSSSMIRENIKAGECIDDVVPKAVKDYIIDNHLYRL